MLVYTFDSSVEKIIRLSDRKILTKQVNFRVRDMV